MHFLSAATPQGTITRQQLNAIHHRSRRIMKERNEQRVLLLEGFHLEKEILRSSDQILNYLKWIIIAQLLVRMMEQLDFL